MNPAIENQDFRPPPEPRLPVMVMLAIAVNVLLIAAVAWGIQSRRDPIHEIAAAALDGTAAAHSHSGKATAAAPSARTDCPLRPLLTAAAGGKDGQVFPPAEVDGKKASDIEALLVAGKEAAAAGLVRDAEVDFLTSCRVADALKGAGSMDSANARYELARHYVTVADDPRMSSIPDRTALFARAQSYYEDSLQRFRAEWGDDNEKTRFAAQGLEGARAALAQATRPSDDADAADTARMGASPASAAAPQELQSVPEQSPRAAAPSPAAAVKNAKSRHMVTAAAPHRAALPQPSFDCRKARSYSERTICADPVLAQLDRDLGRLHARAKRAAADPAAFNRQNNAEWHRREATCRDRSCLLRWYSDRRQQLTQILSQASPKGERTASP
jgi:hypothetical protein